MKNENLTPEKPIQLANIFKAEKGTVATLHMLKDSTLKAHITPVDALLICVKGKVHYGDEQHLEKTLEAGDYIQIDAQVSHWLKSDEDSLLFLIR